MIVHEVCSKHQRHLDAELSLEALLATAIASSAETLFACCGMAIHHNINPNNGCMSRC